MARPIPGTLDYLGGQRVALRRAAELILAQIIPTQTGYDEATGLRRAAKLCTDLADEVGPTVIEDP